MQSLEELTEYAIGITKQEIAIRLDAGNPLFDYSKETGSCSYHNYTRRQLLETCFQFNIDPKSDYLKSHEGK